MRDERELVRGVECPMCRGKKVNELEPHEIGNLCKVHRRGLLGNGVSNRTFIFGFNYHHV